MNNDEFQYELHERIALLLENNPDMHPVHARNKAKRELEERKLRDVTRKGMSR